MLERKVKGMGLCLLNCRKCSDRKVFSQNDDLYTTIPFFFQTLLKKMMSRSRYVNIPCVVVIERSTFFFLYST